MAHRSIGLWPIPVFPKLGNEVLAYYVGRVCTMLTTLTAFAPLFAPLSLHITRTPEGKWVAT